MSGWSGTIPEQLYTYVQTAKPTGAEEGESWYDLDDDKAYVFIDGQGTTTELTLDDHAQLAGVGPSDHHDPVSVSDPLAQSGQSLSLSLANALTVDAGSLAVAEGNISLSNLSGYPVGTGDLGFDTATQAELDAVNNNLSNHESDPTAHHSKPTQTQQTLATTGLQEFVRHVTTSYPRPTQYSEVYPVEGMVHRIRLKNSNGSQTSYAIELQGGTRQTGSVEAATGGSESDYGTKTVTVNDRVMAVSVENTGVEPHDIDWLLSGAHTHDI